MSFEGNNFQPTRTLERPSKTEVRQLDKRTGLAQSREALWYARSKSRTLTFQSASWIFAERKPTAT